MPQLVRGCLTVHPMAGKIVSLMLLNQSPLHIAARTHKGVYYGIPAYAYVVTDNHLPLNFELPYVMTVAHWYSGLVLTRTVQNGDIPDPVSRMSRSDERTHCIVLLPVWAPTAIEGNRNTINNVPNLHS
jgi:hypothetical protein